MTRTLLRHMAKGMLLILCLVSFARAQDGPINEIVPLAIPLSARSLVSFCRVVGFDAAQTEAARTLHQGYRSAYIAATRKVRSDFDDAMKKAVTPEDQEKVAADRGRRAVAYADAVRDLEKNLIDDLKTLCTPEQAERFPTALRARRRESALLLSIRAGERADLVSILTTVKIDRHAIPQLDELVTRWELDLDALLIEKDKVLRNGMKSLIVREPGADVEERLKVFANALVAICSRVAELNKRAAAAAELLVPEASREAFAKEVKFRNFPRIYGPNQATQSFKAAKAVKDLSPEQRDRLDVIVVEYERDAGPINTRWAAAAEEKQRQMAGRFIEMLSREKDEPADPFYAARKDRRGLDTRYVARVNELLSEAQRNQLPTEEAQADHGTPEFLPDFEAEFKSEWDQWKAEEPAGP